MDSTNTNRQPTNRPVAPAPKQNMTDEELAEFAAKGGQVAVVPENLKGMSSMELAALAKQVSTAKRVAQEEEAKNKPMVPRGRGVMTTIRTIVVNDPTLKGDALLKAVEAKIDTKGPNGFKTSKSVVDTARSDTLHTLRTLKEMGWLKDDYAKKVM